MDVSVITVTWNSARFIGEQIASVASASTGLNVEHIVVDNASSDNTVEIIKQFPQVISLPQSSNIGFAAANNLAAQRSKGKYILLLNPDMLLKKDALEKMIEVYSRFPNAGVVGGKLVTKAGAINLATRPRRFPTTASQVAILLKLHRLAPFLVSRYLATDLNLDVEQQVDSVQGSCMFFGRVLYNKLGQIFDPRYYIWFEDVDLCRTVKEAKLAVIYSPFTVAVDYGAQSFAQRNILWKQNEFSKSMLKYFQKWEPWYVWMWVAFFRPISLVLAAVQNVFVRV